MTAKEMAHWEGWLRRGQRQFQLVYTSFLFFALGVGPALVDLAFGRSPDWSEKILASALVSVGAYFAFGWVWKNKTTEYRQQAEPTHDGRA
jgi:hypothetical protein